MHGTISKQLACGVLLGLGSLSNVMAASEAESHQVIQDTAYRFAEQMASGHGAGARVTIKVNDLDSRLKLSKCSVPLEAFESPNARPAGRTTVGVRCEGDSNWKLYVPVEIEVHQSVATLRQGVARNSRLSATDVVMQEIDVSSLQKGFYTKKDAVVGKFVKTALKGGTVLKPRHLENPLAVKKGTMVTILADLGGIQVRMKGKALKSGSIGDWIAVENSSSQRKIEGRILQDGIVEVML